MEHLSSSKQKITAKTKNLGYGYRRDLDIFVLAIFFSVLRCKKFSKDKMCAKTILYSQSFRIFQNFGFLARFLLKKWKQLIFLLALQLLFFKFIIIIFFISQNFEPGEIWPKNKFWGLYLSTGVLPKSKNWIVGVFLSEFFAAGQENPKNGR